MYSIYRSQSAVSQLKAAWNEADDALQQTLLAAMYDLDRRLQTNPREQGESRQGTTRILFLAPLAVVFEVDEEKKMVRMVRAWAYVSRSQRRDRLPWQPPLAE
jgi:hypothetical protein